MTNRAARLRLQLEAARRRWQSDDGAIVVREMVAIASVAVVILAAAVAVLEVAGFDVGGWIGDQLGIVP